MDNDSIAQILADDDRIAASLPEVEPPSPIDQFLSRQGGVSQLADASFRHSIEAAFDTILADVVGADELSESDFVETFGDFVIENLCDDPVSVRDFLSNVAQYVDDYCDAWREIA